MTATERPLCDCPEPCACYAEGYAAFATIKAYLDVIASLEGPPHARGCAGQPSPGQPGLPAEGDDSDRQKLTLDLRIGGAPGPWRTMTTETGDKLMLIRPERIDLTR